MECAQCLFRIRAGSPRGYSPSVQNVRTDEHVTLHDDLRFQNGSLPWIPWRFFFCFPTQTALFQRCLSLSTHESSAFLKKGSRSTRTESGKMPSRFHFLVIVSAPPRNSFRLVPLEQTLPHLFREFTSRTRRIACRLPQKDHPWRSFASAK